ncbi:MAG: ExbD/TolR family protein [Akkermansiaceae bacterium]
MKFNTQQAPPVGFQLAPMIDIIFLLLAFFIVTYQMTDNEKVMEISLPAASEGKAKQRDNLEKVINIHADGGIVIDQKPYTLDELEAKMGNLVRVNKSQPIRVRGDEKTEYKHIVDVINRCSKAGIWNISFATGTPKKNPTN